MARFVTDVARDLHEWNNGPGNHAGPRRRLVHLKRRRVRLGVDRPLSRHPRGVRRRGRHYPAGDAARAGTCWAPGSARARSFPETGHALRGPFLDLWEGGGGLAVFGYPIGDAGCLEDARTGRVLWSQWFQRHRMEYHPELRGTRYEVSLGAAGSLLARTYGIDPDDWTPQPPRAADGPGVPVRRRARWRRCRRR